MNVTKELIAADIMGAWGGARARERLDDIFKNAEIVMKAMKEVSATANPPPPH
jgi:hypothetical protein